MSDADLELLKKQLAEFGELEGFAIGAVYVVLRRRSRKWAGERTRSVHFARLGPPMFR